MKGKVDTNLFRKDLAKDFIIVQIYVDDIIFGATNESLCKDFSNLMQSEFEMSMMGELKFSWVRKSNRRRKVSTFINKNIQKSF